MKYRLMRPSAAFLPAVLLAACFLGVGKRAYEIWLPYLLLQGFALCPAEAFRNAAARETGLKRVDKRFGAALIQLIVGCGLISLGIYAISKGMLPEIKILNSMDPHYLIHLFGTAALIILEQMFDERLYAIGRYEDGVILSGLSNGLMLTALLLKAPVTYSLYAAGLGALIGLLFTLTAQPFKAFSLIPRNYGFVPRAFTQFMLFPAVCAAVHGYLYELSFAAVLTGWLLWRISRSYARRSADESRPLNFLLIAVCAALIGGCELWPLKMYAVSAMIALVCAEIVFLAPSVRLYAGTALLAAALMILRHVRYASIPLCIAAIIINLKHAFLKKTVPGRPGNGSQQ